MRSRTSCWRRPYACLRWTWWRLLTGLLLASTASVAFEPGSFIPRTGAGRSRGVWRYRLAQAASRSAARSRALRERGLLVTSARRGGRDPTDGGRELGGRFDRGTPAGCHDGARDSGRERLLAVAPKEGCQLSCIERRE